MRQIIQEVQPKEESKEIPRIMVKREPRILAIHNFRKKTKSEYCETPGDISSIRKMETRTADALKWIRVRGSQLVA